MRGPAMHGRRLVPLLAVTIVLGTGWANPSTRRLAAPSTFARAGSQATATLLDTFYAGHGLWNTCDTGCGRRNSDWGSDSLTYTLYLRWQTTHERALVTTLRALAATAPLYGSPCRTTSCGGWSDVPEWDSIAASREYEATHEPAALAKAEAAYRFVAGADVYALGACPQIRYQQPGGGANRLKTLETDGNAIKAALLLYRETRARTYLGAAERHYRAVRRFFLDPRLPLYSVYVFDDGRRCSQLPHRFFASVNGDMIWSGVELARVTGRRGYLSQALATARAVASDLSDPNKIFADLQAENDIVEPLVEAFYVLAVREHAAFARRWLIRNAAAALSARKANGAFGRFFDGPPPPTTVTDWQTNGGLALEIAAAALEPARHVPMTRTWAVARYVAHRIASTPASVTIRGSAVAFLGTLGDRCCEPGHARVFVDGRETLDRSGIWQNKSSAGIPIPDSVLFAWRWRKSGRHTIRFEPGVFNRKEGGSFLHLDGYLVGR